MFCSEIEKNDVGASKLLPFCMYHCSGKRMKCGGLLFNGTMEVLEVKTDYGVLGLLMFSLAMLTFLGVISGLVLVFYLIDQLNC